VTDDQLIEALARLLTRTEDRTRAELTPLLQQLALRIRALLLTLPAEGDVVRTILYNNLRPRLLPLLQDFTTAYYATLRFSIPPLATDLERVIARFLGVTPPPPRSLQDLLTTATVLTRPANTLLTPAPNGISPFTLQLERLLNTTVRAAIFRGSRTSTIADLITPTNTRRPARGTVANAWLDRTTATTAALVWSLVTPTMQQAVRAAEASAASLWVWNAVLDPKTCPICRPLDGVTAADPRAFPNGPPPLHPYCRCIAIPRIS
jgi:hypothetical protein